VLSHDRPPCGFKAWPIIRNVFRYPASATVALDWPRSSLLFGNSLGPWNYLGCPIFFLILEIREARTLIAMLLCLISTAPPAVVVSVGQR